MAAILGIVGLGLALMTVGGLCENNMPKALRWGGAMFACFLGILLFTDRQPYTGGFQHCFMDWDGLANPEVCE